MTNTRASELQSTQSFEPRYENLEHCLKPHKSRFPSTFIKVMGNKDKTRDELPLLLARNPGIQH